MRGEGLSQLEMHPTHLAKTGIEPIVSAVAIRTDRASVVITQQFLGPAAAATLEDAKYGHAGRAAYPQPHVFGKLVPARFIQVDALLRLNIFLGRFNRLFQRLRNPLFLSGDAPQTDVHLKHSSSLQFTPRRAISLLLTITHFQTLCYLSVSVFNQLNGYPDYIVSVF